MLIKRFNQAYLKVSFSKETIKEPSKLVNGVFKVHLTKGTFSPYFWSSTTVVGLSPDHPQYAAPFTLQGVHPVVRKIFLAPELPPDHPILWSCSHYRRTATDWTRFFNCQ